MSPVFPIVSSRAKGPSNKGMTNYYITNLPCNLPCTASLANHQPARPRAQWTDPKRSPSGCSWSSLMIFKGVDARCIHRNLIQLIPSIYNPVRKEILHNIPCTPDLFLAYKCDLLYLCYLYPLDHYKQFIQCNRAISPVHFENLINILSIAAFF